MCACIDFTCRASDCKELVGGCSQEMMSLALPTGKLFEDENSLYNSKKRIYIHGLKPLTQSLLGSILVNVPELLLVVKSGRDVPWPALKL